MNLTTFLIVLVGWIFSLSLHEFAHALVAYYGGDKTVKDKGYLTFNPLKYTHPMLSIVFPIIFLMMGGIGLPGGAVYIEDWRIRNPRWRSMVSLAGPAANLLVAIVIALIFRFAPWGMDGIWPGLAFLGLLQVSAVVFNLIPLPPLDGYGMFRPHMDPAMRDSLDSFGRVSLFILFILLWYVPIVGDVLWTFIFTFAEVLGIPTFLAGLGLSQFMFWR
ncbi:MAG: site-2 protease family protein [Anaerolineales bacterium]